MAITRLRPDERRNFGKIAPPVRTNGNTARKTAPSRFSRDQADGLRRMVHAGRRQARVLAVTSGKGGVGKTNVAVNLSISLAAMRRRVVLVDLDLGLANADILFDMTPRYNLSSVISGRRSIEEITVPARGGVFVVPGASGVEQLANLSDEGRAQLLASLEVLYRTADYIVFDTGAGIAKNTTEFLAAADDIIVVTVPEPTAVVDAYAVIKMVASHADHGNLYVLINMAENPGEAEKIASGISVTANKLLNAYVDKLGYILHDHRVGRAVRQRRPFTLAYPGAPCSRCVTGIARRLVKTTSWSIPEERPGFVRRLFSVFGKRA
ncbi:MAG: MinD/ParA family protein [Planctomycetota bacterium]|jgi:flagellar biosynthesis protein FlhG